MQEWIYFLKKKKLNIIANRNNLEKYNFNDHILNNIEIWRLDEIIDIKKDKKEIKIEIDIIFQTDLNKAVSKKVVKGSYADAFKGWGKKCKSQATAATQRKTTLSNKYNEDVKNFTIKLLSDRISRLESLIASMKSE